MSGRWGSQRHHQQKLVAQFPSFVVVVVVVDIFCRVSFQYFSTKMDLLGHRFDLRHVAVVAIGVQSGENASGRGSKRHGSVTTAMGWSFRQAAIELL